MVRKFPFGTAIALVATSLCSAQIALKNTQNENIPVINKEFLIYKGSKADSQIQENSEEHKDSEFPAQNTESQLSLSLHQATAAQLGLCIAASIIKSVTGSAESVNCDYTHHGTHQLQINYSFRAIVR